MLADPKDISPIRIVPEIDNSGSSARIILEQNKFSKKVTYNSG